MAIQINEKRLKENQHAFDIRIKKCWAMCKGFWGLGLGCSARFIQKRAALLQTQICVEQLTCTMCRRTQTLFSIRSWAIPVTMLLCLVHECMHCFLVLIAHCKIQGIIYPSNTCICYRFISVCTEMRKRCSFQFKSTQFHENSIIKNHKRASPLSTQNFNLVMKGQRVFMYMTFIEQCN